MPKIEDIAVNCNGYWRILVVLGRVCYKETDMQTAGPPKYGGVADGSKAGVGMGLNPPADRMLKRR